MLYSGMTGTSTLWLIAAHFILLAESNSVVRGSDGVFDTFVPSVVVRGSDGSFDTSVPSVVVHGSDGILK